MSAGTLRLTIGGARRGSGEGRAVRRLVGYLVVLFALAQPVMAQTPSTRIQFRNLGGTPVRVYVEDEEGSRYVGRVASMSSMSLRLPADFRLNDRRPVGIVVESAGGGRAGIGGNESAKRVRVEVPADQLRTLDWTLAGAVLYSAPVRSGEWSARSEIAPATGP